MFEFRVTKYDPTHRDRMGAYTRDEWTAFSDIGQAFGGVILTKAEYQRVEDAYASAAFEFMKEAGVSTLTVTGLENNASGPLTFAEGSELTIFRAAKVVRRMLREEFWGRLEGDEAFIHIGYDYYMYIGVSVACPESSKLAEKLGLFVEPFESPYKQ